MNIVSPKVREETWTDIDFHFRNGDLQQPTLKPGDTIEQNEAEVLIKLNRPPYSLITIYKDDLRMIEITQRIVQVPIDSKGQPLAPGTEEEDAPGSSGEG